MIYSYNKFKFTRDLEEYLKFKLISPTDYIQLVEEGNPNTKLVACWHFTDDEITKILSNNGLNYNTFVDRDKVNITPDSLKLLTVQEYFDLEEIDISQFIEQEQNLI